MRYTVNKLAKISAVTVRTLHWYDQIGLLKPAYLAENGYRYYEEKQLLILQQILFFRQLGFKLRHIQKIIGSDDFDQINALETHKEILAKEQIRIKKLLTTIDKTILHLKEKKAMSDQEIYIGFDKSRQKEYEQYLVKYKGLEAEKLLIESKKHTAKWDKDEWDEVKANGDKIHKDLAASINKGITAESDEVQLIIARHYQMVNRFYHASKEVYIGLTQLYAEHPDFKKFFDVYHPNMIEFIGQAMRYYANKHL
jgi:DNA-binding transcriptional MerR regulator